MRSAHPTLDFVTNERLGGNRPLGASLQGGRGQEGQKEGMDSGSRERRKWEYRDGIGKKEEKDTGKEVRRRAMVEDRQLVKSRL